ncbi:MAG: cation-transporting P-type ATPase, partial [Verrucomicrobiota bacterium]
MHAKLKWSGLTPSQVEDSRVRHGTNLLAPPKRDPWWKLYLEKFDDPVVRILMIAAVIAITVGFFHGQYVEGVGIITAILLATTIAFVNEFRANKEFDILNKADDDVAVKVIREERFTTVPRRDIVAGDIVLVEMGDAVPADGELLEAVSMQVNEASLTGEALPVSKFLEGRGDEEKIGGEETGYPPNKLFRGTTLVDGHGVFRVTAVGNLTEIGGVMKQAAEEETGEITPLNAQLEKLSKVIGVVGFIIAGLTFGALAVRGLIFSSDLQMTAGQWWFTVILLVSCTVSLAKVWLPVAYDGLELIGREAKQPEWLDSEGLGG